MESSPAMQCRKYIDSRLAAYFVWIGCVLYMYNVCKQFKLIFIDTSKLINDFF